MKRFLLFLIFAIVCSGYAIAYDFSAVCESGHRLYYNITSSRVEVTTQNSSYPYYSTYPTGNLIIPSSVTHGNQTYSVTGIGDYAFSGCSELTSVSIPNSVTSIGNFAFEVCNGLVEITIPISVRSIGRQAFGFCCGPTSVTIPNSVGSIGTAAFSDVRNIVYNGSATGSPWGALTIDGYVDGYLVYSDDTKTNLTGCSSLATEITIPNSVTIIDKHAFNTCNRLLFVTIGNSVTSIGEKAFALCTRLTEITFPYSVTNIGDNAFASCSELTTVTIPSSITSIGNHAFISCSGLTSIFVEQNNSVYDSRDNCNAIIETSTNTLLMGCVNTIIPNSVTSIGSHAFRDFNGLSEITIPNSVTSIEYQAFAFCTGLTDIYVNPTTPPTVGNNCFVDVNATLWVPCGLVETYQAADRWNNFSDVRERLAYELNVSSANPQQGTAGITQQPNCSDGIAIITATPNDGYGFTGWNDGNTDNPRTIVVTTDTMFVATFTSLSNIETNINSEISIFPNPTNDKLNISSSETISEIEIVNAMGQVVKRMEINSDNAVCNVEDLTSGVYVVRFRAINSSKEATISQQKFIKE